ncbi:MAG: DegT/DnrJ/EryC1/StrS family aminotransferase [Bdellovibrionota bacterium]
MSGLLSAKVDVNYVDTEPDGFNQDAQLFLSALRVSRSELASWYTNGESIPRSKLTIPNPILYDKALCDFQNPVQTLKETDAVLHSFGWGKPLASLRGAALFSNCAAAASKWKSWQTANLLPSRPTQDFVECLALKSAFNPILFGVTQRLAASLPLAKQLSGNTAAGGTTLPVNWNRQVSEPVLQMLWSQIETQKENSERRREINRRYAELLSAHQAFIQLPPLDQALSHYPIRVVGRDSLHRSLLQRGFFTSTRLFAKLLCDLVPQKVSKRTFPHARRLAAETLHLPLYPDLAAADQNKIAAAISVWCRQQRKDESCYSITTDVNSSTIPS